MRKICVFAGSSSGKNQNYKLISNELGQLIAKQKFHLFYGGGNSGLMGAVADSCLEAGGKVTDHKGNQLVYNLENTSKKSIIGTCMSLHDKILERVIEINL